MSFLDASLFGIHMSSIRGVVRDLCMECNAVHLLQLN